MRMRTTTIERLHERPAERDASHIVHDLAV
jgi:hypothetical protein